MIENTDKIEDRVIDGKIVFSTYHCVKGRQRPFVFLVGFDNSYFTYYARTLQKDLCPNTLYVGVTRASEGLYLLEFDQYATDRPLEFLRKNHHEMKNHPYIEFKGIPRTIFYQKEENLVKGSQIQEKHFITPTDLIKFVPESTIEDISPIIDRIFIKEPVLSEEFAILGEIEIPTVIKTKQGFYEEVSDLNGIAIPMVYYSREPTVPNSASRYPFGGHFVASEPLDEPSLK